jgi:5-deoxy-glucuronate isomerase
MPKIIEAYANNNNPVVTPDDDILNLTYFNLVRLNSNQKTSLSLPGIEAVYVVLSGNCDIQIGDKLFKDVGHRKDIWSGKADSVYAPSGSHVEILANSDNLEIAVAGGVCKEEFEPFRVTPDEVSMVDVGSKAMHSRRRIYHVLGQNANGRAGNLLVSELYADEGCWCAYPPHKHDDERPPKETSFEEVYHFRFNPEQGFGAQFAFDEETESQVFMIRQGDTFCLDHGYHPTVTAPCYMGYVFTILVGRQQRSLVQHFKDEHAWVMDKIPGIKDMRDKFK